MLIQVKNRAIVAGATQEEITGIKEFLTISNPLFNQRLDLGLANWGIPKSLKYYEYDPTHPTTIIIPVGSLPTLIEKGIISPKQEDIIDQRIEGSAPQFFSRLNFTGTLRGYQEDLVKACEGPTMGVIEAMCGSGKTASFIHIVMTKKVPTLILVNTIELAEQTRKAFLQFTNAEETDIGFIGSGKFILTPISICLHQTMAHLSEEQYKLLNTYYGMVIADEVHICAANTYAATMNKLEVKYKFGFSIGPNSFIFIKQNNVLKYITIEEFYALYNIIDKFEIRSFDGKQFTWKPVCNVLKHLTGDKKVYKIKTEFSRELVLSEDHSIYKIDNEQLVESLGKNLKLGDQVLLEKSIPKETYTNKIQLGMNHFKKNFKFAGNFENWVKASIRGPQYKESWKIRYTRKHGKLGYYLNYAELTSNSKLLKCVNKIYTEGSTHVANTSINVKDLAYLLGFYIGDGWTESSSVVFAVESARVKDFLKKLEPLKTFCTFGTECRKTKHASYEISVNNPVFTNFIKILTKNQKVLNKEIPDCVFSWSLESKKLFLQGMIDSDGHLHVDKNNKNKKRFVYTTISEKLAYSLCNFLKYFNYIASISSTRMPGKAHALKDGRIITGKHRIYTVSFSYYLLNPSHNNYCGQIRKSQFTGMPAKIKSIEEVTEPILYDVSVEGDDWNCFVANDILVHNSATPKRGDGLTDVIHFVSGPTIHVVPKEDLKDVLIQPDIVFKDTNYYFPLLNSSEYQELMTDLSFDQDRNDFIIDIFNKEFANNYVIFLCNRIEQVDELLKRIGPTAVGLTSKMKKKDRKQAIMELNDKTKQHVVSTYGLFSTGVDIPHMNTLFLCAPIKSEIKIRQSAGRLMRKAPGKTTATIVDFVDSRVQLLKYQAAKRKRILTQL